MTNNRYLVEQVTGYFGLVFWSLQLAPQAYKTYRRGSSTGVSVWTMLIWTFSGTFMGVYNIALGTSIALWIQPQIFTAISCICVAQEFRYQHKWSKLRTTVGFLVLCMFCGGLEVGLVFAFKKAEIDNNQHAIAFFGVLPVIFVLGGYLPQYFKIFKNRRVIGLSYLFVLMDVSGSIFSIVSLVYGESMNALDLANYAATSCFDLGIFVLYYFFEWYNKTHKKKYDEELPYESREDLNDLKSTDKK